MDIVRDLRRLVKRLRTKLRHSDYNTPFVPMIADSGSAGTAAVTSNWTTAMTTNSISTSPGFPPSVFDSMNNAQLTAVASGAKDIGDIRIEKKPVEVVAEIMVEEPTFDIKDLKKQIAIVEKRLTVLKRYNGNISDETLALRYLNSRRYYEKKKKMFPWKVTTNELIEKLIEKYKVRNVAFGSYSKSVPIEATDVLEQFADAWEAVVDDDGWKPDIRLIIDYDGPEYKKDPILLMSSPFGRWWYVGGAWDREVEIVDKIIYKGG